MTYQPRDLHIVMSRSMTRWHWVLADDEGETVEYGEAEDYQAACDAQLAAFNRATATTQKVER